MTKAKAGKKLVWRVCEAPTGMYRSFQYRSWPSATFDGNIAFRIACTDPYVPRNVKTGNHEPLKLLVADRRTVRPFAWKKFKQQFANLAELKKVASEFCEKHPHFFYTPTSE